MRATFKERTVENKVPTDFAVVSWPANMIVLHAVSMDKVTPRSNAHWTCGNISSSVNLQSWR